MKIGPLNPTATIAPCGRAWAGGKVTIENADFVRGESLRRGVSMSQVYDEALTAARTQTVYSPMPGVIGQSLDAAAIRATPGADPVNR